MLGTAFAQSGVLLVEQPGPWGHAGLTASRFDPAVAVALEQRAAAAGLRVLAIRRPGGGAAGPHRRWAILPAHQQAEHHRLAQIPVALRWGRFDADAELLDVALDGSAGEPDPAPIYLVCAHGKRDVCCALEGRPLAAALAALRPGRVWECSHTGGHRFAPIVLALPIGAMSVGALYGRVPAGGAAGIVAATERGRVLPELLRGLIGHPPVEQAALGYALQRCALQRCALQRCALDGADADGAADPSDVAVVSSVETAPGRWEVRLDVRGAPWLARLAVELVETPYASCAKPAAKPERQLHLLELGPA